MMPSHLRFSSAYAWNASALRGSSFNLAQAKSVQSAAALAERGLPSALAAFQGPVFVRTTGTVRLSSKWRTEVDKLHLVPNVFPELVKFAQGLTLHQ